MHWIKLLCIIAYGIMFVQLGMKIYDKSQNSKFMVSNNNARVEKTPHVAYSMTASKNKCVVFINTQRNNTAKFEDIIADHEAFVHRQLHNKTDQIECFFATGTDEYKLIKYTRSDSKADEIKVTFHFEYRQTGVGHPCYNAEYNLTFRKLDGGIVNREGILKCSRRKRPENNDKKPVPAKEAHSETTTTEHSSKQQPEYTIIRTITGIITLGLLCFINLIKSKPVNALNNDTETTEVVQVTELAHEIPVSSSAQVEKFTIFMAPEPVEIQSKSRSSDSGEDAYDTRMDQLTPIDMELSEESSFEHIN